MSAVPVQPSPGSPRSTVGVRAWASTSAQFEAPGPLLDVLTALRHLRDDADSASSAGERAGWLTGLRELVDTAEVMFTDVLTRFDAMGDAPVMSAQRDSTAWLCNELRLSGGDARSRVRLARDAGLLTEAMASVNHGELRFEHVRAISAAVRPLQFEPDHQAAGVAVLHDLARRADPAAVRQAGRRLREVVDPDGALRECDQHYARRHLRLSPLLDGMTALEGVLDAEGAATVSAALAPLMVPTGPDDLRSAGQRRADALVEVSALALRSEGLPVLSGTVAAVDVVVAMSALTGPTGGHGPVRAGVMHDAPGAPVDLPLETLKRLMCDAAVGRVLLGPDSAVLELGRRVRLFSKDQRRALTVRDGGCRAPGCTRPPRYTDAHHVVPWEDGGPSDLVNAMLLCRYHHNLIHRDPGRGGWRVVMLDATRGSNGPVLFCGPAGQRVRSEPRGGP